MMDGVRRYLIFTPSLVLGLVGAVWLALRPPEPTPSWGPLPTLALAAGLALALLGGAWWLERTLPSFRYASRQLERALVSLRPTRIEALLLALLTAAGEELFFRGALLPLLGVLGQALLFGLLHPAGRRGWSYTVYTFAAGLGFGWAAVWSGSLWAPFLAHAVVNLQGFLELRRRAESAPAAPVPLREQRDPDATTPARLED